MTRSCLAAVLVLPVAAGIAHPAVLWAQDTSTLAGRWTLNRELSQFPREVGFSADWMSASGSGGNSTSASGGNPGGPPGGGRTSFPVSRVSREDSMRNALLTGEVRDPAGRLVITETAMEVTFTPDKGAARTLHPSGREEVLDLDGVPVTTTATRDAGRLIVRYKVNQAHEIRYTYSRTASPPQLIVEVQLLERGKGDIVRRVYEPDRGTDAPDATRDTVPDTTPADGRPAAPAPGNSGAAQEYDRQPDAQFRGLTTLGVVVEGLGTQATTCGLRQEAIESAVVKQLSGAGLKASINADEDTYVYVNVITATLGNGMCISRYDAFLYTHTTAGLSYHPTPVLVNVSLMHKGSLAAGGAAAHAESVMRGLQDAIGQFTARIRDANK